MAVSGLLNGKRRNSDEFHDDQLLKRQKIEQTDNSRILPERKILLWDKICNIFSSKSTRNIESSRELATDTDAFQEYKKHIGCFDPTVLLPKVLLPRTKNRRNGNLAPTQVEIRNIEFLESAKALATSPARDKFQRDANSLLSFISGSVKKYGYKEQCNLVQCAGHEREAELTQNLTEALDSTIDEAFSDTLETQMKCDIVIRERIHSFNDDMAAVVDGVDQKPSQAVVAEIEKAFVTKQQLNSLNGLSWLDGEVINYYLRLIEARSSDNSDLPKVYTFNTFLYAKLCSHGYKSVRRWTKKADIFSFDLILFPIHLGNHWTLAYADTRKKVVRYLDSMGGQNPKCLGALLAYLKTEHQEKFGVPLTPGWTTESCANKIPLQKNICDCGVFTCKFAEYISRDQALSFTQQDMPNFRLVMKYEILTSQLTAS